MKPNVTLAAMAAVLVATTAQVVQRPRDEIHLPRGHDVQSSRGQEVQSPRGQSPGFSNGRQSSNVMV